MHKVCLIRDRAKNRALRASVGSNEISAKRRRAEDYVTFYNSFPSLYYPLLSTHTTSYNMFRAAIPAFRAVARSSVIAARPVAQTQRIAGQRWYAASAGLDKEQITSRVLEVLKGFEKVDGGKVSPSVGFLERAMFRVTRRRGATMDGCDRNVVSEQNGLDWKGARTVEAFTASFF